CRSPSTTLAARRAISATCERHTSKRACFDSHCGIATTAISTNAAASETVQKVRGENLRKSENMRRSRRRGSRCLIQTLPTMHLRQLERRTPAQAPITFALLAFATQLRPALEIGCQD